MSLKFNDNGKIEKSDRYYKVTPLILINFSNMISSVNILNRRNNGKFFWKAFTTTIYER